jgi:hypothetical protein
MAQASPCHGPFLWRDELAQQAGVNRRAVPHPPHGTHRSAEWSELLQKLKPLFLVSLTSELKLRPPKESEGGARLSLQRQISNPSWRQLPSIF